MSYKISAKNRKLKRTILNIISILKFESLHIEISKKIILFWVMLAIGSLFLNWIDSTDQNHIWNAFKNILWITGYVLLIIHIKILFIIFSKKLKELIKFFLHINANDGIIIIFLWMFWLIMNINTIFIIENFSHFSTGIWFWKPIILSIIGCTLSIIWWILMIKTKTNISLYIESENGNKIYQENRTDGSEKNNMKLPF